MAYKLNIFTKPYVAKIKRGNETYDAVFYATSVKELRERLEEEFSDKTEILSIRERE